MFLSFVIPVHNARPYLPECLESVLAQDARVAYEVVCVDDGSTDGSAHILADFAAREPRLRVLTQENRGVSAARNAGLAAARGAYIWFVDADDLLRPDALTLVHRQLAGAPRDRLTLDGYRFTDAPPSLDRSGDLPDNAPWYDAVVWRNVLRRGFLTAHGLSFRPELTHGEDGLFLYELLWQQPETAHLPQVLYFYREHSGSAETAANTGNRQRKLRSYIRIVQILRDYYDAGRTDAATADKLMSFLWFALYEVSALPGGEALAALRQLHELGLFPYRRLPECTLERSYMTDRPGLTGRALDALCRRLHTPWAFAALWTAQHLRR